MTKFADDLLRALDEFTGVGYNSLKENFFEGDAAFVGFESPTEWMQKYDLSGYYSWKNMNVSFKLLDEYGGEGMGDEYWKVYEFTDNNSGEVVLVKFDGWYASYEGAEFTDMSVVQPVQKVVTVYE